MADFRTVQTRMWREDAWFQELPVDARLLWVYLFTNPSASICGMYRLPIKTIAFESGLTCKRVEELMRQFEQDGKIAYEDSILWVIKMRDNQLGGKVSQNQQTGIDKDMDKVPPSVTKNMYLEHYGYPTDTLPIGRATLRYVTVTDTVTDTDTVPDADASAPPPDPTDPVVVYMKFHGLRKVGLRQQRAIKDGVTDLGKWRAAMEAWSMRGFKPQNVGGQLEWYRDGVPVYGKPGGNGRGKQREPVPLGSKFVVSDEYEDLVEH